MAMICVKGTRECDGCMACQKDARIVYTCVGCGADIYEGYDYYNVAGVPYCEDCVSSQIAEICEDYDYYDVAPIPYYG